MIMYFVGVLLAAAVYTAVPAYHEKRFFEGYSPMVWLLIFVQASYGLCVGYAYKYADVLIKKPSRRCYSLGFFTRSTHKIGSDFRNHILQLVPI